MEHICPVWVGYLLACPARKLAQSPQKILASCVRDGDMVADIGCAMGFFSVPMAKMVGETGRVICLDVQEKMLQKLRGRAEKAGVLDRLIVRQCLATDLQIRDMNEKIDFALAFSVVHEVPDQNALFAQIVAALKRGGRLLISEPKAHVSQLAFARSVIAAKNSGLTVCADLKIPKSRSVLMQK
ncbi:class I SAM-dependent methyltransferase [candidate division KSB1 bacterium]|nr:class I SAM-dependent methyltransferase [candidate division KSB1 bacterium]